MSLLVLPRSGCRYFSNSELDALNRLQTILRHSLGVVLPDGYRAARQHCRATLSPPVVARIAESLLLPLHLFLDRFRKLAPVLSERQKVRPDAGTTRFHSLSGSVQRVLPIALRPLLRSAVFIVGQDRPPSPSQHLDDNAGRGDWLHKNRAALTLED